MGLSGKRAFWRWGRRGNSEAKNGEARLCRMERMEPRQLLAANVRLGGVYYEDAGGDDIVADTLEITWQGGAPGTELKRLAIDTDKLGDGLTIGDTFFDTAAGGLGAFGAVGLSLVSHNGFEITGATVADGGTTLVLTFAGFNAGERLVFSVDVDEQGFLGPNAVAEGNEFEGSTLAGTFAAPHFFEASAAEIFRDAYDSQLASSGLDLPPDSYQPPSGLPSPVRTAGSFVSLVQVPLPISINGTVFEDRNVNNARDGQDGGIAGVQLTLQQFDGEKYVNTGRSAVSDAAGGYRFENLLPGRYRVVESQPAGYFSIGARAGRVNGATRGEAIHVDVISEIELLGGEDSAGNDFAEALPGLIRGMVHADADGDCLHDPGETLLSGVVIQLLDGAGQVIAQTTTNAEGRYEFGNLAPGAYGLHEVQPAGYFDSDDHVGSAGGRLVPPDSILGIALVSGTQANDYNFCEHEPVSIAGLVYIDDNDNGLRDGSEAGIGGVQLVLLAADGAPLGQTATTDSLGAYRFADLPPGVYGVAEVQPSGFYDGRDTAGSAGGTAHNPGDRITGVSLPPGTDGLHYNFGELRPASIRGLVHADRNGDGTAQDNEPRLSGVVIELLDAQGRVVTTTTTNAQGQYALDNLAPGTYGVRERQPAGYFDGGERAGSAGGTVSANDQVTGIVLGSGRHATDYDFFELEPASVRGMVHADRNGDCVYQEGEPALAGVVIQLLDQAGNLLATTTTDSQGRYAFEGLAPGVYGLRELQPAGYFDGEDHVGSAGGALAANDLITGIALGANVHAVDYSFCEAEPASISGLVHADRNGDCVYQEGEPRLAGVVIQLLGQAGNVLATTTTDSQGVYRFEGLVPGVYGIRELQPEGLFDGDEHPGSAGGHHAANDLFTGIALGPNVDAVDYNFCEQEPASVGGLVHADTDGNGRLGTGEHTLAGVTIQLLGQQGRVLLTTTTDGGGRYLFTGLAPGRYGIRELQPAGYFDGQDHVGSAGGFLAANDLITQIDLGAAVNATGYDFSEIPPAALSGFVFQDGPDIELENIAAELPDLMANLPNIRSGLRKATDRPIAGVRLQLADAAGTLLLDGAGNAIETTTNALGFYIFTGLPPGLYTVLQVQPDGYLDGIDRAGSLGGVAVNQRVAAAPGPDGIGLLNPTLSASLVTVANGDAIALIPLGAGQHALENNFSEIRIVERPNLPLLILPVEPTLPDIRIAEPALREPMAIETLIPSLSPIIAYAYYGGGVMGYTWHLSVIDAGRPRGDRSPPESKMHLTSVRFDSIAWQNTHLNEATWVFEGDDRDDAQQPGEPVAPPPPATPRTLLFGKRGGIPVAGDFDGDGLTEVGVFVDGEWFIDLNGNGVWDEGDLWASLGSRGDLPVTGDWDGDGKTDIGVYGKAWPGDPRAVAAEPGLPNPHNVSTTARKNMPPPLSEATLGWRAMKRTREGELRADVIDHVFHYGTPGDMPVTGDWTGGGVDSIGVFRNGRWVLDVDGDGKWSDGDMAVEMGSEGDLPVVGDFDGDGIDELGLYRDGVWRVDINHDRALDEQDVQFELGQPGDRPVVGDWDGDGVDQIAVYREHEGTE